MSGIIKDPLERLEEVERAKKKKAEYRKGIYQKRKKTPEQAREELKKKRALGSKQARRHSGGLWK